MGNIKLIKISDFILKHGVEKLANHPMTVGDYSGVVRVTETDLEFHKKDGFSDRNITSYTRFHNRGNYRFSLLFTDPVDGVEKSIWVYKSDLVEDIENG